LAKIFPVVMVDLPFKILDSDRRSQIADPMMIAAQHVLSGLRPE
jgi:hypothetical protein